MRHARTLLPAVLALGVLAAPGPAAAAKRPTVKLRGTAYEFNAKPVIAGASIRVAEIPSARATTKRDGSYVLTVPDRKKVTPYVVARGYHTIYLQTFTTAGKDLANVNFQTPTDDVYHALAALLNVPLDANGDIVSCAIVSTSRFFRTRATRGNSLAPPVRYTASRSSPPFADRRSSTARMVSSSRGRARS